MKRYDIINHLINECGYIDYLEIGVRDHRNFKKINCFNKIGVDPNPRKPCTHMVTSDYFFENIINKDDMFDIIFIDGLHLEEQVDKDVKNGLKHLKEGGVIVLHDCNPPTEWHTRPIEQFLNEPYSDWNGTVWKSMVKARMIDGAFTCVVDTDWGCGIIKPTKKNKNCNKQSHNLNDTLKWEYFNLNRENILNLMQPSEFLETKWQEI